MKTVPSITRRLLSAELTYLTGELGESIFYDYHLLDEARIEYSNSFALRYPLTEKEQEYVHGELEELVEGYYFFMGSSAVCLGSKYAMPTCHIEYFSNRLGDGQAAAEEANDLMKRIEPFATKLGGRAWIETDQRRSRHLVRLMLPLAKVTSEHSSYGQWIAYLRKNLSGEL